MRGQFKKKSTYIEQVLDWYIKMKWNQNVVHKVTNFFIAVTFVSTGTVNILKVPTANDQCLVAHNRNFIIVLFVLYIIITVL